VTQDGTGGKTVGHSTLVIFAAFHVPPQAFHVSTMRRYWATTIVMWAFSRVMQQQQTLLLVPYAYFPLRVITTA
jgi:hypothetical protein